MKSIFKFLFDSIEGILLTIATLTIVGFGFSALIVYTVQSCQ